MIVLAIEALDWVWGEVIRLAFLLFEDEPSEYEGYSTEYNWNASNLSNVFGSHDWSKLNPLLQIYPFIQVYSKVSHLNEHLNKV